MSDFSVNNQFTIAPTQQPRNDGFPNEHKQIIKKKNLYILIYYRANAPAWYKTKISAFKRAALFKRDRLKEKYPDAVFWVKGFTMVDEFRQLWTDIYKNTSSPNDKYNLMELHYIGHSGWNELYFLGHVNGRRVPSSIHLDDILSLEKLEFDQSGILVLHSCLSSRYEYAWEDNKAQIRNTNNKKCIAKSFAEHLQVKTLGQMVKSSFLVGDNTEDFKYKNSSFDSFPMSSKLSGIENSWTIDWWQSSNLVLWGYKYGKGAILLKNSDDYKSLAKNQIWPSRTFDKSGKCLDRIVATNQFNQNDLIYI